MKASFIVFKRLLMLFVVLIGFVPVMAQQVQYASKVLKYSSDLGGKLNSVKRILGKPDVFPQGGNNGNAWAAKVSSGYAFVEVEFEQAQTVRQIAVFENLNAGCVNKVMVADASGKFRTVSKKTGGFRRWLNNQQQQANTDRVYYFNKKRRKIEKAPEVDNNADITYIFPENPELDVKMVRIEFDFNLKPGQKQVDAIGISDSEEPIVPVINMMAGADKLPQPETVLRAPGPEYGFSSLLLAQDQLYYTIYNANLDGEIHALNLKNPSIIADKTGEIKDYKKLNYLFGYSSATKLMLLGSEKRFRWEGDPLGFSFYKFEGGILSYEKPLKVVAYANYGDYADAFYCNTGDRIIFSVESDQTQGGFDFYFTIPKDENTFGLLQNMGKSLNTAADEANPFLLSDQKTLLFAGNGYSGYGDYDLYVSTRLDDTWKNWSEPRNLGPLINGPGFDMSPYYDEQTEILYYVTYKDGIAEIRRVKIPAAQLKETK